jgi:hypothetical protein
MQEKMSEYKRISGLDEGRLYPATRGQIARMALFTQGPEQSSPRRGTCLGPCATQEAADSSRPAETSVEKADGAS